MVASQAQHATATPSELPRYTNETRTDRGRPGIELMNSPAAGVDGTDPAVVMCLCMFFSCCFLQSSPVLRHVEADIGAFGQSANASIRRYNLSSDLAHT